MIYLQNAIFYEWACLDSNQEPLPYQGSKGVSGASYPVRESALFALVSVLLALLVSYSVRLRSDWVAARLLHAEHFRRDVWCPRRWRGIRQLG
ncbi:MAG: hypothetical protein AVDCRST_MAG93-6958 [uncultured Chloroflexia bacterium]|uniref:Uncharacterized protein n=1 Tax=uncultured Chloroflexia bacterium TaxID=1672391 RepID=A0A6J4M2K1_9CHLR|nr:MAG: hypothetical protein AVDCRST_MAG93-6958 [uncultured Chloroflexia bacterium]